MFVHLIWGKLVSKQACQGPAVVTKVCQRLDWRKSPLGVLKTLYPSRTVLKAPPYNLGVGPSELYHVIRKMQRVAPAPLSDYQERKIPCAWARHLIDHRVNSVKRGSKNVIGFGCSKECKGKVSRYGKIFIFILFIVSIILSQNLFKYGKCSILWLEQKKQSCRIVPILIH